MFKRFEDILAWQKAQAFSAEIFRVTSVGTFARDFDLRDQIRSAARSVHANIAEGYERGSMKDFHRFVCIAKGSCAEARSHLYEARNIKYLDDATFDRLMSQGEEVARYVGGLRIWIEEQIANVSAPQLSAPQLPLRE